MVNINLPKFLEGFRINRYYKFLGYLFGLILILSFFLDVNEAMQKLSIWMIFGAMGAWIIDNAAYYLRGWISDYFHFKKQQKYFGYLAILVLEYALQIYMWYYILINKLLIL